MVELKQNFIGQNVKAMNHDEMLNVQEAEYSRPGECKQASRNTILGTR